MNEAVGKGWTVANIPNQLGRRALVTGANSGIGYWTAVELAHNGAYVLLGCRDRRKGEAALARMQAQDPRAKAEVVELDLASLESVRNFAAEELAREAPLDLLINNAGVMTPKRRQLTADGFEIQFGINVLGHFALTALLLPALERAVAARSGQTPRVVTISSIAHKTGRLNFEDLQSEKSYSPMGAYRQSKLADLMFAFELDRRFEAAGPAVACMSVAAHPGVANTNLFQTGEFHPVERIARRGFGAMIGAVLNTDEEGAVPTLFAATAPEAKSGGYYGPQWFFEMGGGNVGPAKVAPQALDEAAARRLWSECQRLTGLTLL